MAYIVVEDFRQGLDRRKKIYTAPPGTLWTARNAHLTRGGELEKRKAFVSKYSLPAGATKHLHEVSGALYVFGHGATPGGMPAGVNYQRLQPPDAATLIKVLAVENFNGQIYAIAEFSDGDIYHYYNGSRVTTWDGIASSIANNNGIASSLQAKIDADPAVSTSVVGAVITITAAVAGTTFTIAQSTVNGGTNSNQSITLVETVANVSAVTEVLATTSFAVTGGSSNPGVNKVNSITVDGVDVLGAAVNWATSNSQTAANIASQINTFTSSPNYTASAVGNVVTISAVAGTGSLPNGFVCVVNCAGDVTATTPANMSGGVSAVSAVARVVTATIGGTFEAADTFTITINGLDYVVSGAAAGTGRTARTLKNNVYSTTQSLMYRCAEGNPNQWGAGTGATFHNIATQASGSEQLTALGVYQNNMAVFTRKAVQIWFVDPDPVANRLLQVLNNIGTFAANSIAAVGDSDIFFLAPSGVRSLRARDSSNSASVYDIGTPIDPIIIEAIKDASEAERNAAIGFIEPVEGRYWLALEDKFYIFTFYPTSKISAWSIYEPGWSIDAAAVANDRIYVRSGDTIYLYGGDNDDTYDAIEVEIVLPFADAKTPGTEKTWGGLDVACEGAWTIEAAYDINQPDERDTVAVVTGTTFGDADLALEGKSSHIGFRLVHNKAEYASLSKLIAHYEGGEAG
jgi:hypothetical protein